MFIRTSDGKLVNTNMLEAIFIDELGRLIATTQNDKVHYTLFNTRNKALSHIAVEEISETLREVEYVCDLRTKKGHKAYESLLKKYHRKKSSE